MITRKAQKVPFSAQNLYMNKIYIINISRKVQQVPPVNMILMYVSARPACVCAPVVPVRIWRQNPFLFIYFIQEIETYFCLVLTPRLCTLIVPV